MEIWWTARRHDIADEDILHATRIQFCSLPSTDDDVTMFVGISRNADLLEIGILDMDSDEPIVIHAMRLRKSFYKFL